MVIDTKLIRVSEKTDKSIELLAKKDNLKKKTYLDVNVPIIKRLTRKYGNLSEIEKLLDEKDKELKEQCKNLKTKH